VGCKIWFPQGSVGSIPTTRTNQPEGQSLRLTGNTRTNRRLADPDHGAGDVKRGKEVDGASIISCRDVSKVFELVEEPLMLRRAISIAMLMTFRHIDSCSEIPRWIADAPGSTSGAPPQSR
jgi:hypothetical protein